MDPCRHRHLRVVVLQVSDPALKRRKIEYSEPFNLLLERRSLSRYTGIRGSQPWITALCDALNISAAFHHGRSPDKALWYTDSKIKALGKSIEEVMNSEFCGVTQLLSVDEIKKAIK